MNRRHRSIEQARAIQLAEDRHDAAGAMHVLEVIVARGRDLAQIGHPTRQPIDVAHVKIDLTFLRGCQKMQHRIGRAAHRNVQRYGVLEGGFVGDVAWQRAGIVVHVVALSQFDDSAPGLAEQLLAVCVRGEKRAVAG